ncbi:hypothetical protein JK202_11360 [Gluconobacter sp. Dm-62]|uniref:hypothetical protein n=1 Tax=Gluconobacter sp. Dm-62 TaxID=2799804 RepID=UPI001B8D5C9A|nr:hypothetical protein [Gluconobacter sp. Dm-62]MBS1103608.1 hypothetical protein [Gluconobacter sp. Dm-62]
MTVPQQSNAFFNQLRQINGERGFLANLGGFFCVSCMMGLGNLFSQSLFHENMAWILGPLMVMIALYFFVPYVILLVTNQRSTES